MREENNVGTNMSTGAEKVERIEAELKQENAHAKAEQKQAQARVEEAQKRAAEKAKKKAAREAEEKALFERYEKKREERAHAKAERNRSKSHNHRNGKKGNGGWIAAVVALGAITLGLATTVTVGAIDMKKTKEGVAAGYRSATYELVGIMENVDSDLDRVRISNTPAQQSRILTDLLVQARLAELDLEKLPIDSESNRNVTTVIHRVAAACEGMLGKLRNGETLSEKNKALLVKLYHVNHEVRTELEGLTEKMTDKDVADYVKDGKGMVKDVLDKLEKTTLEENRPAFMDEMKGAGTNQNEESEKKPAVDPSKAEALCEVYFADYDIGAFQCVGETVSRGMRAYNVQGYDKKGMLLFAEVSSENGALVRFDYHETCNEKNFDTDQAKMIGESFLENLGYDDMEIVRVRENGTEIDFTFAYEDDDIVYYPDSVKLKVCLSRGVVTALDTSEYLRHHKDREDPVIRLTMSAAKDKLHKGLTIETARLAVVKTARGERPAYEFLCSYEGERYFVYLDAQTGAELSIVNIRDVEKMF